MKQLTFLFLFFSIICKGTTYYISTSGNDSYNGTAINTPWQTLKKVNSTIFKAGDQILFQRNNTFYGSLTINQSGTLESPILIGAYGTGSNPIITGFTKVTSWTNLGSNIWESTNTVSTLSTCNLVLINGINTPMGKIPNKGYYPFQSHSGSTSITSSSLSGTTNWTGAEMVMKVNRYLLDRRTITSQSSGTLNFTAVEATPIDGFGFFIQNDSRTLDTLNEWYYNPSTNKLRVYNTSQPTNVSLSTVDYLLTINGSFVTVDGLTFTGANNTAIYNSSTTTYNIIVQNCKVNYCGMNGIQVKKYRYTIQNDSVLNCNFNGIVADNCKYSTIQNNVIQNIGTFAGIGNGGGYNGISAGNHNGVQILYNKIMNVGYCGVTFYGDSISVKNNYVNTFCTLVDDGGGVYWYNCAPTHQNKVLYNIAINGIGNASGTNATDAQAIGIYNDGSSGNTEIAYNTAANCSFYGYLLNNPFSVNFHHNTSYNNWMQFDIVRYTTKPICQNNIIKNNIFISKYANQVVAKFHSSLSTSDPIYNVADIDSNYYARPIDDFSKRPLNYFDDIVTSQAYYGNVFRNFSDWKAYSGKDIHSHISPQNITNSNDILLFYNNSTLPVITTIEQHMIGIDGNKYNKNLLIYPYSSIVLLKDNNIIDPCQAPRDSVKILILTINTLTQSNKDLQVQLTNSLKNDSTAIYKSKFLKIKYYLSQADLIK